MAQSVEFTWPDGNAAIEVTPDLSDIAHIAELLNYFRVYLVYVRDCE